MQNNSKKIFLIGNSAKDLALIKKILADNTDIKFFVLSATPIFDIENIEYVDIREDNPSELLEFAVKNEIDLTIVTSNKALKSDITAFFNDNNQNIFAPNIQTCEFAINKAVAKKYLYKLGVPTPRFAIYEKEQLALDYLKNATYPTIISTSEQNDITTDRFVCTNEHIAKTFIGDLYFRNEPKVIIEEFLYGHEFTFYAISDGYAILPITSVANYKFLQESNGGKLSSGIGCYCHDYKIESHIENNLLQILEAVINDCQAKGVPYLGIIGIDCVLYNNGEFSVLEFTPFFKDHDANAVLNLIDDNFLTIIEACINGSFADDYEKINISEKSSVSCTILANKDNEEVNGLENIEHSTLSYSNLKYKNNKFYSDKNQKLVITSSANTLSRARKNLYEDIENISFKGMYYRQDICSE